MESITKFILEYWPLLLPVVLGFLAVYWLLPRGAGRDLSLPGAAAGAAALIFGGWLLIRQEFIAAEAVLFYSFSGIAIIGAGLMLAQHNPVRAALAFALVVLSTCGLFLLLAAPFLMAATIIIYAGAIIITFLFVIMLAQQIGMTSADRCSREPFLASLAGFLLLGSLLVLLHRNYDLRMRTAEEPYGPVLEKLERAQSAATLSEAEIALGKKEEALDLDELKRLLPEHEEDITNFELEPTHETMREFCKTFIKRLQERKEQERQGVGSLQPAARLRVSPFGGVAGKPLPARNVEALGRALFTDYLVAVVLGGVLLLVATIGAIVIAGRRGDGRPAEVL